MEEDLKKILEQNSADMAEMKKMVRGIKNHFIRSEIYQWLVIVLIVLPFVVGMIVLWPQIKSLSGQYGQIMSNGVGAITGTDENLLK
jgi:Gpi18-like mannosyltransferase